MIADHYASKRKRTSRPPVFGSPRFFRMLFTIVAAGIRYRRNRRRP